MIELRIKYKYNEDETIIQNKIEKLIQKAEKQLKRKK
jgi:hypothetical protein